MPSSAENGSVLVVDDNAQFQAVVADYARLERCRVTCASTLQAARRLVAAEPFDLVMVDLDLPDGNGLDLIDDVDVALYGHIAIITGHPSVETAARAVSSPVVEYLLKPLGTDALARLIERAKVSAERRRVFETRGFHGMIGQAPVLREAFEKIRRVAPLDVTVLVQGESGTGKELVARAIHEMSGRKGALVPVNCGAIAGELLSSQLFGHERGSFTGALQSHAGFFEQAQGGTLFLDEITEMPIAAQVYLLRVIESRTLYRVGGSREIALDVRLIAATNRDLRRAVAERRLRADLYYRLLEFPITLPALRERRDDIARLAQHFLELLNRRYGTHRTFAPGVIERMSERPWPGNIRELRHAVQRMYILCGDRPLDFEAAPISTDEDDADSVCFRVGMTFDEIEREMLLKTLASHKNNKQLSAQTLGVTPKTIYNRLLRYRSLGLIGEAEVGRNGDDDLVIPD